MTVSPQAFRLGNSTILVHNDEFEDGYSNGFVASPKDVPLTTDSAIYEFIVSNILDICKTSAWNAGYIIGAIRGLFAGPADATEPAPQVQLGTLTLHLNDWRFREGFYVGQEDYPLDRNEQTTTPLLKASDLLHFIAQYDPNIRRYYLGEDELAALEDILGQLVGYLCAALFPRQEPSTGPLEQCATLQEA